MDSIREIFKLLLLLLLLFSFGNEFNDISRDFDEEILDDT